MGKVTVVLHVYLKSPDDTDKVVERIKSEDFGKISLQDVEIEPIGFGIKKLKILLMTEDSEGGTDSAEEKIRQLEGVQNVEVGDTSLV